MNRDDDPVRRAIRAALATSRWLSERWAYDPELHEVYVESPATFFPNGEPCRVQIIQTDGGYYERSGDEGDGRADMRIAAAAPSMARALLAVEAYLARELADDPASQEHGELMPVVDAALTAAGLPDQASRDAIRARLK